MIYINDKKIVGGINLNMEYTDLIIDLGAVYDFQTLVDKVSQEIEKIGNVKNVIFTAEINRGKCIAVRDRNLGITYIYYHNNKEIRQYAVYYNYYNDEEYVVEVKDITPATPEDLATLQKQIINLTASSEGKTFTYLSDNGLGYYKTVPANAMKYAVIERVGGISEYNEELGEFYNEKVTHITKSLQDGEVTTILTIPTALQALEGYGMGINATVNNYIDFVNKKYVKMVEKINTRDLSNWIKHNDEGHERIKTIKANNVTFPKAKINAAILVSTNEYTATTGINVYIHKFNKCIGVESSNYLSIYDSDYTNDLDGLIEHIKNNPFTIMYELETPVEIDISELLKGIDEYIEVAEGSTIAFESENQLEIPNTITYQIKVV